MMDAVLDQASDAGLGRVRRYARHPALAVRGRARRARRCSRGCRSASTRSRSSSTCASRPARSRSPALVSGTLAAGSGVGAPLQGRLVDRIGARRVLLPLAVVHAVALGAIVGLAELGAPTVVLRPVRLHRRLRDPADLVGAALDVDRPARAAAAPGRLRAGLDDDRADLHQRPAADRGDRGAHLAGRRADRLRGRGRSPAPRSSPRCRRRATSSPSTSGPRACSARSPRRACARSC